MTFKARPYQVDAVDAIRMDIRAGKRRIILYSPTGSGKTQIGMMLIKGAMAKGRRVMFVAHRITLTGQASRRFWKSGIPHGMIQGLNTNNSRHETLVCSIDTLRSRGFPELSDLIIIDEAHTAAGNNTYRELIENYPKAVIVGLSATPFTRGLGKHYDSLGGPLFQSIVVAATIRDLIEDGHLVDVDIYAPQSPDLKGVPSSRGKDGVLDYNEKQLAARVNTKALVGGIVEHWQKLAGGKRTVCFATNIAHSKAIVAEFLAAGVPAEHIDCFTEERDRADILGRLDKGETKVVSNVSVLAEGWDCPAVEVCVLARPTRSLTRFIQMVGRVLRPAEGKTRALMLDHSGSTLRLGYPTDDLPLELNDGRVKEPTEAEVRKQEEALPHPCPACHYMKPAKTFKCPRCGHEPLVAHGVEHRAGDLVKLKRKEPATMANKQEFYSEMISIQREKHYQPGWVDHKYREKFGVWPRNMVDRALPPSKETLNWLLSKNIANSYRRKTAAALGIPA